MKYFLLVIMTLMGAVAALFLKKSANKPLKLLLKDYNIYIGGSLYFVSALINIYLLTVFDFMVILPLLSLTYVWTFLLSFFILKEKIRLNQLAGILLIIAGMCILAFA